MAFRCPLNIVNDSIFCRFVLIVWQTTEMCRNICALLASNVTVHSLQMNHTAHGYHIVFAFEIFSFGKSIVCLTVSRRLLCRDEQSENNNHFYSSSMRQKCIRIDWVVASHVAGETMSFHYMHTAQSTRTQRSIAMPMPHPNCVWSIITIVLSPKETNFHSTPLGRCALCVCVWCASKPFKWHNRLDCVFIQSRHTIFPAPKMRWCDFGQKLLPNSEWWNLTRRPFSILSLRTGTGLALARSHSPSKYNVIINVFNHFIQTMGAQAHVECVERTPWATAIRRTENALIIIRKVNKRNEFSHFMPLNMDSIRVLLTLSGRLPSRCVAESTFCLPGEWRTKQMRWRRLRRSRLVVWARSEPLMRISGGTSYFNPFPTRS